MISPYKVVLGRGAAYYPIRKAASSSIQEALHHKHSNGYCFPSEVPVLHTKFSFVRNPFDRMVGLYEQIIPIKTSGGFPVHFKDYGFTPGMPFEHFINAVSETEDTDDLDPHLVSQHHWLALDECFFVGKFEKLEEDWRRFWNQGMGRRPPILKHFGYRWHEDYREYYDPITRDMIWFRYEDDFMRWYPFSYSMD